MRRPLSVVLLGLLLGVFWSVVPAIADELPPPSYPSGLPDPGDIGNDVPEGGYTPGPTIIITPGSTGTALPQPTQGTTIPPGATPSTSSPAATPTTSSGGGPVVPDATPRGTAPTASPATDDGSPLWLAVAAGLVILLGMLAAFGGVVQQRVTRDPASR